MRHAGAPAPRRFRTGTCGIIYLKQTVKNKDEEYRFPNGIGE